MVNHTKMQATAVRVGIDVEGSAAGSRRLLLQVRDENPKTLERRAAMVIETLRLNGWLVASHDVIELRSAS